MSEQFADAGGRYRLVDRIATGGMGVVWRGWDTVLNRDVAVKILKAEFADDQGFRARFAEEARHAAALHHPNIAALFDTGETPATDVYPPRPFLVMELVEGQPLNHLIRPGAPMAPAVVADLMAQAADALGAAHRAGIVHRDVKPGNLLVTPARQVKITDFGIARAAESVALTRTGQVMGTPQYLSPEQATGEQATPASDVYSLGCVAYECLAGRRPFDAETSVATALAHVRDEVPPLPATVPTDLASVVMRSLSKKPADRFPNGSTFAAALRDPAAAAAAAPAADPATSLVTQALAPVPVAAPGTQVLETVPGPVDDAAVPAATPPGGRRRLDDEEEKSSNALWWWLTGLLALALLVGVLVWQVFGGGGSDPSDDTSETPSVSVDPTPTDDATEDPGFELEASAYLNRQFAEVSAELISRGLRVKRDERPNPGDETPGLVTGINPTGQVQKGRVITVSFWGPVRDAPSEEPSETPSEEPSETPSQEPSEEPSEEPTTQSPTSTPTQTTPSAPASETASSSPEAEVETQ